MPTKALKAFAEAKGLASSLLKFNQTELANMTAALEYVSQIATGPCQFAT